MKTRIVQIDSIYPRFANEVCEEVVNLGLESYSDITRHIISSGYNSGHNIVPYLDSSKFESYIIFNGCYVQLEALARDLDLDNSGNGCDINVILEGLAPNIIYVSDLTTFDFASFKLIKSSPKIIGWHATSLAKNIRFDCLDLLLSGISQILDYARRHGCKVERFYPGAICRPTTSPVRRYQVSFVGSNFGGLHTQRTNMLLSLARDLPNIDFYYFMDGLDGELPSNVHASKSVFGNRMLDVYAMSKIVLDIRADFNFDANSGVRESSNMRILEATSEGALVITEATKNLSDLFVAGQELVSFSGYEDLVKKISYYASDDNSIERESISASGYRRVKGCHTMERRAEAFERLLGTIESHPVVDSSTIPKSRTLAVLFFSGEDHLFNSYNINQFLDKSDVDLFLIFNYKYYEKWRETPFYKSIVEKVCIRIIPVLDPSLDDLSELVEGIFRRDGIHFSYKYFIYLSSRVAFDRADIRVQGDHLMLALNPKSSRETLYSESCIHLLKVDLERHIRDGLFQDFTFQVLVETLLGQHLSRRFDGIKQELASSLVPVISLIDNNCWHFSSSPASPLDGPYIENDELRKYLSELTKLNNDDLLSLQSKLQSNQFASRSKGLTAALRRNSKAGPLTISLEERTADPEVALTENATSWEDPSLVRQQHQSFRVLLDRGRAGDYRIDLKEMRDALASLKGHCDYPISVMEIGCGTGYMSEIVSTVYDGFEYVGVDKSHEMISQARLYYPHHSFHIGSDQSLPFEDRNFSIVISGASMMHSTDPYQHICEATRVAKEFVYIHTLTTTKKTNTFRLVKEAYGRPLDEVVINQEDLGVMLDRAGLIPTSQKKLFKYSIESHIGIDLNVISILCKKGSNPKSPLKERNYYYTYFDSNYAIKGMAMLASLQRFDSRAFIYVVGMDNASLEILKGLHDEKCLELNLDKSRLRLISINDIESFDQDFRLAKTNRSLIEWYFTSTSCIANFLIDLVPIGERLTYLDADLYFFASPQEILEEALDSSVQIIPHRFSDKWRGLEVFGKFNVGWISFCNSSDGRQVITDYREKCLAWCYDRVEGEKFADQKYLDRWPNQFKNVCISQVKGANVGWWNISGTEVDSFGPYKFIDENPLIFIHASGVSIGSDGYFLKDNALSYGEHYYELYKPYIVRLNFLKNLCAKKGIDSKVVDIRYATF